MKSRLTLTLMLAALAIPALATADTAGSGKAAQPSSANSIFAQLDRNHDGKLTAAEMTRLPEVLRQQRFDRMDSNHDGKIEKSEFEAAAKRRADRRFAELDRNHDGVLSAAELAAAHRPGPMGPDHHPMGPPHGPACAPPPGPHGRQHHWQQGPHHRPTTDEIFARMDRNNDGYVTRKEWNQAVAQWRDHHHRPQPPTPAAAPARPGN